MNKEQIKRELRRSATKDNHPWYGCQYDAMQVAIEWKNSELVWLYDMENDDLRTFYLLVAEAL